MDFDTWMTTRRPGYLPSDDSLEDRLLRQCWAACTAAQEKAREEASEEASAKLAKAERRAAVLQSALKGVLDTQTGKQTLLRIQAGQGIRTADGCTWVRAAALAQPGADTEDVDGFPRSEISMHEFRRELNLRIGDTDYVVDRWYLQGARAARDSVPWASCPYGGETRAAEQWGHGHVHELCGFHKAAGLVVSPPSEPGGESQTDDLATDRPRGN